MGQHLGAHVGEDHPLGSRPADFAKQWIAEVVLLAILVFGVRYVMRFNILGCFLIVGVTALSSGAAELLGQPNQFYKWNGYGVIFALVLLLGWPLWLWRAGRGDLIVISDVSPILFLELANYKSTKFPRSC